MRPPQVRTTAFISYICQIYCIHFGQYWTLFCNANSSSAYSLISGSCSSDRDFAFSFLQIPSCDGHPCYWLMVATTKPHNGLSPSSCRPCWAHINKPAGAGLDNYSVIKVPECIFVFPRYML